MTGSVRTRFAPSPTGYLHIGGARTALFAWAYARRHHGRFVLRIEDTDRERSTDESVQAILDGMRWLGLDYDEGPHFQTQRMARYRELIETLRARDLAYPCYCSREELDAMRASQRAQGLKPRYDGTWRPEPGKLLPPPPAGVEPVIRFRNPTTGSVVWDDLVKGRIEVANAELDDLIIARADGSPTYNFCVVVDDLDMAITHVIRGDDHVNNTPRQINILSALGARLPHYAHVPMILGADGERLSKRHGAVSVMQYAEEGYLPEAMLNYLARLGWSHGDDEIFDMPTFARWFDLEHIARSPAQFDPRKLAWLNAHYLKTADPARLVDAVMPRLVAIGLSPHEGPALLPLILLYRDRVATLNELADVLKPYYQLVHPEPALLAQHLSDAVRPALAAFRQRLPAIDWQREALNAALKEVIAAHRLKMPQLAIPLRVLLLGQTQTPSIDAVLEVFGRERVITRLDRLA
ncbi:MAG: glutamate--tRNA ligase [Betaproteobacteria bacterium]|nr:glutamate--tRNA ligase [Rhodocyclaceae bacterium]MCG3186924.1 Glutamate--tRNA ligase [Rhodocyclaceae bacterium]